MPSWASNSWIVWISLGYGNVVPARRPDGTRRLVEVYRPDLPWSAPPPEPGRWTSDEELEAILASVDTGV